MRRVVLIIERHAVGYDGENIRENGEETYTIVARVDVMMLIGRHQNAMKIASAARCRVMRRGDVNMRRCRRARVE